MTLSVSRGRLLAGAALGLGLATLGATPALADSVCPIGFAPPDISAVCTATNGNGTYTELLGAGSLASIGAPSATALITGGGDFDTATTSGYIESTTAGRGVLAITDSRALTYTGTGSTLVTQAGATGSTVLDVTAPSVTLNTGTLTAVGTGSDALHVTLNGGAGSGGGTITVDGNITTADGDAVVVNSTNAAADQALTLHSNVGATISATGGDAVNLTTAGTAPINVTLDGVVNGDTVVTANGDHHRRRRWHQPRAQQRRFDERCHDQR